MAASSNLFVLAFIVYVICIHKSHAATDSEFIEKGELKCRLDDVTSFWCIFKDNYLTHNDTIRKSLRTFIRSKDRWIDCELKSGGRWFCKCKSSFCGYEDSEIRVITEMGNTTTTKTYKIGPTSYLKPNPPGDLSTKAVNATTIQVNFTAPENWSWSYRVVLTYVLMVLPYKTVDFTSRDNHVSTLIGGLDPNTQYLIKLYASYFGRKSRIVMTNVTTHELDPPINLTVSPLATVNNIFRLNWNLPSTLRTYPDGIEYRRHYYCKHIKGETVIGPPPQYLMLNDTMTSLNTTCHVRVALRLQRVHRAWSRWTDPVAIVIPNPPGDLSAKAVNATAIRLNFTAPENWSYRGILTYVLMVTPDQTVDFTSRDNHVSTLIGGLDPNTQYLIKLYASYFGRKSRIVMTNVTTHELDPPINLTVSPLATVNNIFRLNWNLPSTLRTYPDGIEYRRHYYCKHIKGETVIGPPPQYLMLNDTMTSLNTTCHVRVALRLQRVHRAWSRWTDPVAIVIPNPPGDLSAKAVNATAIRLNFTAPENWSYRGILTYVLMVTPDQTVDFTSRDNHVSKLIGGLDPNTQYRIKLYASYDGRKSRIVMTHATTHELDPPINLTVSPLETVNNIFRLNWNLPSNLRTYPDGIEYRRHYYCKHIKGETVIGPPPQYLMLNDTMTSSSTICHVRVALRLQNFSSVWSRWTDPVAVQILVDKLDVQIQPVKNMKTSSPVALIVVITLSVPIILVFLTYHLAKYIKKRVFWPIPEPKFKYVIQKYPIRREAEKEVFDNLRERRTTSEYVMSQLFVASQSGDDSAPRDYMITGSGMESSGENGCQYPTENLYYRIGKTGVTGTWLLEPAGSLGTPPSPGQPVGVHLDCISTAGNLVPPLRQQPYICNKTKEFQRYMTNSGYSKIIVDN